MDDHNFIHDLLTVAAEPVVVAAVADFDDPNFAGDAEYFGLS